MGGVEGFKVGNYDGYIYGKNEITAGKTVGKKEGYATLNEALDVAKAAEGAEVITQKDGKFFLNEVRGTHYSEHSESEVSVRAYKDANFSKVVAFTDDYNNVIAQADDDPNLEKLGKIDQVKQKLASLPANTNPEISLKIAGSMLGVGSPETYTTARKLEEALKKMPKYLPEGLKQKFEAMLKPESLKTMAVVLALYAGSHAIGVGEGADAVLAVAGLAFLGADAIKVGKDFYDFASTAANAKTDADLERAAAHLADGVSTALVDGATTLVGARAAKGAGTAGKAFGAQFPPGGGLQPAFAVAGGGRIPVSAAAATAGAVRTPAAVGGVVAAPIIVQMNGTNPTSGSSRTPANNFYKEISKLPANERVPVIKTKAKEFADSQGWQRARDIESKNAGRTVYRDPKTNQLYSVDTQHGHFEVLNPKGKHQGSINLWGEEVPGKLDKSGGHDLNVK